MVQSIFNPGDIVKLSSGSPAMTVSKAENGLVKCVWFDETRAKFEQVVVSQALLVKQMIFNTNG
jgi:uncharacterized protein YodC (DUF2158 family)